MIEKVDLDLQFWNINDGGELNLKEKLNEIIDVLNSLTDKDER